MSSTRVFRDQHEELRHLMGGLRRLLDAPSLDETAFSAFEAFAQTLHEHLTQEDRGIYPRLLAHEVEQVRVMAQIYQAEMGSLGRDFGALTSRWSDQAQMEAAPPDFAREVRDMLNRLEQRMDREDHGLYTLVDRL